MITYALDYETYYDKECSIRTLGPYGYFNHPSFDAYMVSVVGDDGFSFVGHPDDFDWGLLENNIVLSHNASFDQTLYRFGLSKGWWPMVNYAAWYCTADMAAYCGYPRNLAGACKYALGVEPDKSTRANMSGKHWLDMDMLFKIEVKEYALKDSQLCLELWQKLGPHWPGHEKEISRVNREALQNGIPIDVEELQKAKERVHQYLFEAEQCIPWMGEQQTLSRVAFNDECRKMGIEPPKSLAKNDPEAQEWIEKHGGKYKWIKAVGEWRRINSMLRKLEAIDCATMANGRYYGNIMYWGAHTGRFSGGGGNLNLQNLPREEMFSVDLRKLIKAPAGKKLIVVDLSQIEVRTLLWLAKDKEMLKMVEQSDDIYEAFAIKFGMWSPDSGILKKEEPHKRHIVKAMVLGAGFMAGPKAFAAAYGIGKTEAGECIAIYRKNMRKVAKLWGDIESRMSDFCALGEDNTDKTPYTEDLPLRKINYGHLHVHKYHESDVFETVMATIIKHSKPVHVRLWPGLVTENLAQGLARDIFADSLVRLEKNGHKILFHVHDEVIIETAAEEADEALDDVINIMSTPPDWIPDIPLAAEGNILTHYEK